jgi:hypothetical protein
MKVRIRYSDGHYEAEKYTDDHAKAGLAFVEVCAADWQEYQEYLEMCRHWHGFLRGLDNEQFTKDQRR